MYGMVRYVHVLRLSAHVSILIAELNTSSWPTASCSRREHRWTVLAVAGDAPASQAYVTSCAMTGSDFVELLVAFSSRNGRDRDAATTSMKFAIASISTSSGRNWTRVRVAGVDRPRVGSQRTQTMQMHAVSGSRRVIAMLLDENGSRIVTIWVMDAEDLFAKSQRNIAGRDDAVVMSASRVIFEHR